MLFVACKALSVLCSVLLYSSSTAKLETEDISADANAYLPFKVVDHVVTRRIAEELDSLADENEEGEFYLLSTHVLLNNLLNTIQHHVTLLVRSPKRYAVRPTQRNGAGVA